MKLQHIVSAKQFSRPQIEKIFSLAEELIEKKQEPLAGKVIATLFFEPSTRTRLSFEAAAQKLGARILSTENAMQSTKATAGETLADIVKIVGQYADAIVFRHPEVGSAAAAAAASEVPLVNAGDGAGEHPTQVLGDLYTIQKEIGRIDNTKIALVGDLKYGRTVHSLLQVLQLYSGVTVYLVSPPQLGMPEEYKKGSFQELDSIEKVLPAVDVLYVTRIQKERFATEAEYNKLKGSYVINSESLKKLKKDAIIMHPLPRVDEIDPAIDSDPRAAYFRQAKNGLYLRMALLSSIFSS